jgi:hypothetical protein
MFENTNENVCILPKGHILFVMKRVVTALLPEDGFFTACAWQFGVFSASKKRIVRKVFIIMAIGTNTYLLALIISFGGDVLLKNTALGRVSCLEFRHKTQ